MHSSSVTQLPRPGSGTVLPFHRTIKCSGSVTDRAGLFAFDKDNACGKQSTPPVLGDLHVCSETDGALDPGGHEVGTRSE